MPPEGWKNAQQDLYADEEMSEETECDISDKASRKSLGSVTGKDL